MALRDPNCAILPELGFFDGLSPEYAVNAA